MTQLSFKRDIIYRCAGQWGLDNIDDITSEGETVLFTRTGEVVMSLTKETFCALMEQPDSEKASTEPV